MEKTNILVTGGTGFVGSAIVSALLETRLYTVTAVDINPPSLGTSPLPTVSYVRANILDMPGLQAAFDAAKPAIVVHTVGVYPLGTARYTMTGSAAVFEVNEQGTKNVVAAAQQCGARGLVYTSSVTVVIDQLALSFRNIDESWPPGRADTSYGLSKAAAEAHVLAHSSPAFPTTSLRPSPVFGPNDPTVLPALHALIAAHQAPFVLGTGANLHDFVYVANVADAHVLAVANLLGARTAAGEAFFISNGEPVALRAFCKAVWREFGCVPAWEVRVPEGVAAAVAWVVGALGGGFAGGMVRDGCRDMYVSIDKARRVLGYEPRVGLDEGVRRSCQVSAKRRLKLGEMG
jgi:sterol-4alpha-carboxylate 3-dehydrogenase (decarboxylating)